MPLGTACSVVSLPCPNFLHQPSEGFGGSLYHTYHCSVFVCADACVQLNGAERPQHVFPPEQPESELIAELNIWLCPHPSAEFAKTEEAGGDQNCFLFLSTIWFGAWVELQSMHL